MWQELTQQVRKRITACKKASPDKRKGFAEPHSLRVLTQCLVTSRINQLAEVVHCYSPKGMEEERALIREYKELKKAETEVTKFLSRLCGSS